MRELLLVPLEDVVVFPNMTVTLGVEVGDETEVLLVPEHEGRYASVGTVASVGDPVRMRGVGRAVTLQGLHRARIGAARTDTDGGLRAEVEEVPDEPVAPVKTDELAREYRAIVEEILQLRGDDGRIASFLRAIAEPGALADTCAYSPELTFEDRVRLLETVDVVERLRLAVELQRERLTDLQVREKVRSDVESEAHKQQREYVLRKQLESIKKELGEDETSVAEEYRAKIDEAGMPDAVRTQAERELSRFEKIGESSPESQVIRNYLDWLLRSEEHTSEL